MLLFQRGAAELEFRTRLLSNNKPAKLHVHFAGECLQKSFSKGGDVSRRATGLRTRPRPCSYFWEKQQVQLYHPLPASEGRQK